MLAQNASKTAQEASKTAQKAPRTTKEVSKTAQEASKGTVLGGFGKQNGDKLASRFHLM